MGKQKNNKVQTQPIDLTEDDDEFAYLCSQVEDDTVKAVSEENTPNFDKSSVVSSTQYTHPRKNETKTETKNNNSLCPVREGRENKNKRPREEPESRQKLIEK